MVGIMMYLESGAVDLMHVQMAHSPREVLFLKWHVSSLLLGYEYE